MHLTVFPSNKGDCLLLTGDDGRRVLVDGGMASSFDDYVAPALAKLRDDKKSLDVVYVSHIDDDHISGILKLLDDTFAWKVYDAHQAAGDDEFAKPKVSHPPAVGRIWHNAFSEQLKVRSRERRVELESALATVALAFGASPDDEHQLLSLEARDLATSVRKAIELNNRIDTKQLGIALNPEFKGELMRLREAQKPIAIGGLEFRLIGPSQTSLDNLRKEWDDWLRTHKEILADIDRERRADEDKLGQDDLSRLLGPLLAQATKLGDRTKVTPPNLASLMFYVQENGTSILLTGDGAGQDILEGLGRWKLLDDAIGLHVDVLKVQHHGSENNIDPAFCRRITADHYVICGNGAHANPDLAVIDAIADSRLGSADLRSTNPSADAPFTFWFNSSSTFEDNTIAANRNHMKKVEQRVAARVAGSGGRMRRSTSPTTTGGTRSGSNSR
jgi:ribonuclease BN (tRNA processing enzyme)